MNTYKRFAPMCLCRTAIFSELIDMKYGEFSPLAGISRGPIHCQDQVF